MNDRDASLIHGARRRLGVDRLAFSIHDASFPAGRFDIGRGTPCSDGAHALLGFVAELGFDVLQLGPQGETTRDDPSPYSGAAFSRSTLTIHAADLCAEEEGALLSREDLETVLGDRPDETALRADHAFAWSAQRELLDRAFRRSQRLRGPAAEALRERQQRFGGRHRAWLDRDGLYEALARHHGGRGSREWPDGDRRLLHPEAHEVERFARRRVELDAASRELRAYHRFTQRIAFEQHASLRRRLAEHGLAVYGDLQIGLSDRDVWALAPLLLPGYLLGAPPSRTNPAGQPWGYGVLDPSGLGTPKAPGPATLPIRARLDLAFALYDGLRIDHPHGWVCPWVYRADDPDPGRAVRNGARLFSSHGVEGHEALARYDIVEPSQVDFERAPWHDRRVHSLEPAQVDRYAILFDQIARAARSVGHGPEALVCEVLSTLPHPLERVLARYGLGRFRVTGKLDPTRTDDPYRIEAAEPPDWVMIGSHDTPPIWSMIEDWDGSRRRERAVYAASLLEPEPRRRERFAETLAADSGLLAQAMLAELFVARARNVMVFFSDLLGLTEAYNQPGTVSPRNWSLRVPTDFRERHAKRLAGHRALNVPFALALALRAREGSGSDLARALFEAVERQAPVPESLRS